MTGNAPAEPDLETLRAKLASPRPLDQLLAMQAAARMGGAAAPLVPLLLEKLTSDQYVPCTSLEFPYSGHALIAWEAMSAIEAIKVAPDAEVLQRLLADHQVLILPEACYDQGAYIGDYASQQVAPAGLAARIVPLLGETAFALLPDLLGAGRSAIPEIGLPARRAIGEMSERLPEASAHARAAFGAAIEEMAALPEAVAPTTPHGFDLRDLAVHCRKRIAAVS